MSDLGQRLVDAASDAFDVGTFNFGVVVANVLRELDAEVMHRVMNNLEPVDLIGVADSIEKGQGRGD